MNKINIFKDDSLNKEYLENGFIILNLFDSKKRQEIKKYAEDFISKKKTESPKFFAIPNSSTADDECSMVGHFLKEKTKEEVSSYITDDFECFCATFLIKKAKSSNLHWHIDSSFYNQRKFERPFAIWTSIDKTTANTGCLRVVPKSHKLAFDSEPFSFSLGNEKNEKLTGVYNELIEKHAIDVPLKKGEVIIHDNALIHSSAPNNSFFKKRIAFKLLYFPKSVNEFEMVVFDKLNRKLIKHQFQKDELSCNTAKTVTHYMNNFNQMPEKLIDQVAQENINQPFTTLEGMEKIMMTPIVSLKSSFELF